MDILKSTGESSSKGQEDGDASTGSERPLKKARFAWQVKGKHRIKHETDDSNKNLTRPPSENSTTTASTVIQGSVSTLGNKVKKFLVEKEYSKLDSRVSLCKSISNISAEQPQYPKYISTCERIPNNMSRTNISNSHRIRPNGNSMKSVSMVDTAEDECIAQWQAKQIVNSSLDNQLNKVLESWTADTLQAGFANSGFFTRDFAEFINHLPGDNSVENEGILMAISAHGLQSTPNSSTSNGDSCSTTSPCAFDTSESLRCVSPVVSDNESQHTKLQCETETDMADDLQDWQSDNQKTDSFTYFSEPSQSPYHYNHPYSNMNDSMETESHFDFMNAAVLYAIKSKGLTSCETEYG